MVSIPVFESGNPGSNPGGTFMVRLPESGQRGAT
jgi:hypothetical protein